MRRLLITGCVILCSLMVLTLTGCTSDPSTNEENNEREPSNRETLPDEREEERFAFPLTGTLTTDPEAVNNRPVAATVNNDPKARPQSGLHQADLVFEMLAEGAITRFLAVYQSEQPEIIGPVRSARDYYVQLAEGFDAFYVAHGWSPEAEAMLTSANAIDNINGMVYDGTLFERVDFRSAPHDSYITFDNILKGAELNDYEMEIAAHPLPFLSEDDVDSLAGDRADEMTISYSGNHHVRYQYDENTEKYLRFNGSEQTIDRETERPIELDNVFVIETEHQVIDSVGRRDIDLVSGGDALLFQKGIVQHVQWENDNGRIVPEGIDGTAGFVPGQTWINLIPTEPGIEVDVSFDANRD